MEWKEKPVEKSLDEVMVAQVGDVSIERRTYQGDLVWHMLSARFVMPDYTNLMLHRLLRNQDADSLEEAIVKMQAQFNKARAALEV